MEKPFRAGICILAVLLAATLGVCAFMRAIHAPIEENLTQAHAAALAGDMEQAKALADEAYSRWDRFRTVTAIFADQSPMDDAECLFAEMQVFADTGEDVHFISCCAQLEKMMRAMADAHTPSVSSLL